MPFPRPRTRTAVLEHPEYYECHRRVIDFLDHYAQQLRSTAIDGILRRREARPS